MDKTLASVLWLTSSIYTVILAAGWETSQGLWVFPLMVFTMWLTLRDPTDTSKVERLLQGLLVLFRDVWAGVVRTVTISCNVVRVAVRGVVKCGKES